MTEDLHLTEVAESILGRLYVEFQGKESVANIEERTVTRQRNIATTIQHINDQPSSSNVRRYIYADDVANQLLPS